ncbi:MAG TPA: TIGR04255 family protein [Pirellulaceae bacterium]|jgi:uncharacterized protein (TIGR04255 family)|nr:TIGR04255 family protein [Pirellulaceae bacterium]
MAFDLTRTFRIPADDEFESLPKAPVAEAVIHFRTPTSGLLSREELTSRLAAELPDFNVIRNVVAFGFEATVDAEAETEHVKRSLERTGLRLEKRTDSENLVVQFLRDGLVFSQLDPYPGWHPFVVAALNVWRVYRNVFAPREIERIGVRYISKTALRTVSEVKDLLEFPPTRPREMDFLDIRGFVFQTRFGVPGNPYEVAVARTIQPGSPDRPSEMYLIMDIDVATNSVTSLEGDLLSTRLREMRWLKNKAFFGSITQMATDRFKGEA